ncbi:hypothetical protein B0T17DRAFT_591296 [Bombardia bombarda]|uniref:Aminoglycoside phosphotransferase domain-containing protein n=1 Tax=Bombardia bombarda TaxID=252184 RepID=A0AA39WTX7_9PEZI|nr:hypothetical protein B0T17DRAFT_591296 [Bombardia bombarda]
MVGNNRGKGRATLHPDRLPCSLDGGFLHGAYNLCQKFTFSDNATLIRERTSIPVPTIYSWGVAADNPLGLGAFILMSFIKGTSINRLLRDSEAAVDTRLMREDISDRDVESLFRQMADFQLQLFELDFDRIGSLPTPNTGFSVQIRPLTWKVHDIIQTGGVNTFSDRTRGFSTTTDYFQYVVGQDCEQLIRQPNSVAGPCDAERKYTSFQILASLVPEYINERYDRGPYELVCDDFGLANLIVKSDDDLTVVGVVDLEWSYVGLAQLSASVPWWLLQDRPINPEWDCDDHQPPDVAVRYFRYLEIYKRVLEEEEAKRPGHEKKEMFNLVRWSEDFGSNHVGIDKWKKRRWAFDPEEVGAFVAEKTSQLEGYDAELIG